MQMDLQKAGNDACQYTLVESKSGNACGRYSHAPASDPFALQDRVAGSVIHALRIQLRPDEQVAVNIHGTALPTAYDYTCRAKDIARVSAQPERVTKQCKC